MSDLRTRERVVLGVTIFTIALGAASLSWAQEAINLEEPTPSSVDQITTSMEKSFKEKPALVVLFPRLKEELKNTPPFFRDTKLDFKPRTYYFYNSDDVNDTKSEAWAVGGALSYRSGWFLDRFALGSVLYTSQRLYGDAQTAITASVFTGAVWPLYVLAGSWTLA